MLLPTIFETVWPAACRTFRKTGAPGFEPRSGGFGVHHVAGYTTLLKSYGRMRAEGLEPPESGVTPDLQSGAFAAQPRPRILPDKKTERATGSRRAQVDTLRRTLLPKGAESGLVEALAKTARPPPSEATRAALSSRSQGNSVVKQQKERDSWLPREAVPLRSILEVYFGDWRAGDPLSRRLNLVLAPIREARILNRDRAPESGFAAE